MNDNLAKERDLERAGARLLALALVVSMCDADPELREYVIKRLTEGEES